MNKDMHTLVTDFLELQRNYQFTRRALMTKERFRDIAKCDPVVGLDITRDDLKEPLIEHVGHLPILATFLHEHTEHKEKINLGRSLIMLAIHDIGETKLGDVFAYTKTNKEESDEVNMARSMLSPELLPYFDEYEANETFDAKFAKAIDIIAPNVHEVDLISITTERFRKFGGTLELVIQKKRMYVAWDRVLAEFFDICIKNFQHYENKETLIFPTADYDLK